MKRLIFINGNFINKKRTLEKISLYSQNQALKIIENNSGNLLNAFDQFYKEFTNHHYDQACIIWVTGVTFTNLLHKKIIDKNIVTLQSLNYLNLIQKVKPIDILILGHDVLGQKNLQLILKEFLAK